MATVAKIAGEVAREWAASGRVAVPPAVDTPADDTAFWAEVDRRVAAAGVEEAFNPHQSRYPRGHPKGGQWRPALSTGAGRLAPGHLARDIAGIKGRLDDVSGHRNVALDNLLEIGQEIEKTALRYSARRHYEKRLADLRDERTAIQDRKWEAWEAFFHHPDTTPEMVEAAEPEQFLTAAEQKKLVDLGIEELRLLRERDHADRSAMLGVLRELRPMGGKLKQAKTDTYSVDGSGIGLEYVERWPGEHSQRKMARDLDESLKEVLKVLPKAWLDDTNAKGDVQWNFSRDRAWASTTVERQGERDLWHAARAEFDRLGEAGHEFVGRYKGVHVGEQHVLGNALVWRDKDTGHLFLLSEGGTVMTGVGDYADTKMALNDEGQLSLPVGTPTHPWKPLPDSKIKEFVGPMKNLPQPRVEGGTSGAMGMDWDAYTEVRNAVKRYESEGWKFVGLRGVWATLRKGDEEVSLNWGGDPLTAQIGPPEKRNLPPLNPYGQIPLPPIPSKMNTLIRVDPRKRNTVAHEIAHRMEAVYGEENRAGVRPIESATKGWLRRRTQGEALVKLKDLYPGYAYKDDEYSQPDRFVDGYIGKHYGHSATEVLTMGLEMLFFGRFGERDINKDPEMRRLILGILGTL